jgi:hypothetical protein
MFLEDGIRKSVKFLRKALRVNIIMWTFILMSSNIPL